MGSLISKAIKSLGVCVSKNGESMHKHKLCNRNITEKLSELIRGITL